MVLRMRHNGVFRHRLWAWVGVEGCHNGRKTSSRAAQARSRRGESAVRAIPNPAPSRKLLEKKGLEHFPCTLTTAASRGQGCGRRRFMACAGGASERQGDMGTFADHAVDRAVDLVFKKSGAKLRSIYDSLGPLLTNNTLESNPYLLSN